MADANTGSAGLIRVDVSESSSNPASNTSVVSYAFYLIERVASNSTFQNTAKPASVDWAGVTTLWSGGFTFDWRPAGLQTTLIVAGSFTVTHNPDGSGSVTITGNIGSTGTSGAGGPTSVSQGITLTKLTSLPGTPSSVAAVRNSDSQVTVSWAQSSPSNGQPTSNTVRRSVNGGAWETVNSFSPSLSVAVAAAANQKIVYGVKGSNAAGDSSWSADSLPVYTTPPAPSGVTATKTGLDIGIGWANNVAFTEYQTVIWHGVISGGVTTWDGSPLATVASGVTSYTHGSPNTAQVHVYQVQAKNLDTGALTSTLVQSNSVQLLTAPNAPTFGTVPAFANKAAALPLPWTHNPVDTTGQTAYEFGYSTNGGTTWSTTGKVTSGTSSYTIPASTYAGNVAVTIRVRTWGQATSGGSDGTGASPWSTTAVVTFKTLPVASIISPANSSTLTLATLTVVLGFSQAEAATFVQATISLYQGATLLEQIVSTTPGGTTFATRVNDGGSYTVKATVTDSNSLTSALVSSTFTVDYTNPVVAGVTVTYLKDSGIGQIDIAIAAPGVGEAAAVAVTIVRTINGVPETVVDRYPAAPSFTILDMTPTINGTNLYTVTTFSADGAKSVTIVTLTTAEEYWAFLNTGTGFATIINFLGDLKFASSPSRSMALVQAAGRSRPIALFGASGLLEVSGSATLIPDMGSSWQEIEAFLLAAGRVCYRDPSGRRVFGALSGSLDFPSSLSTGFQYKVSEAS